VSDNNSYGSPLLDTSRQTRRLRAIPTPSPWPKWDDWLASVLAVVLLWLAYLFAAVMS